MYPRGFKQDGPRQAGGPMHPQHQNKPLPPLGGRPMNNPGGHPMKNPGGNLDRKSQQRRMEADKLIADCYSKRMKDDKGKMFVETAYQTHINIKEYSSFPSNPPPPGLPPNQIGNVKERVLVLCIKHSGRIVLQKGKFNEAKNVYQIGRTWDLDELKAIFKVEPNGFILTLNKDYYWSVDEGHDRIFKFCRYLTSAYGGFVGRYPRLSGFTVEDFKLPATPNKKAANILAPNISDEIVVNEPHPNPALLKTRSLKKKNLPNPVLPPEPQSQQSAAPGALNYDRTRPSSAPKPEQNYYKDFDFTSNGKLPMKPMKVMLVDRPSNHSLVLDPDQQQADTAIKSSETKKSADANEDFVENYVDLNDDDEDETDKNTKAEKHNSHPYSMNNVQQNADITQDSQSFVFKGEESYSPEKLHEYAQKSGGAESPLRNYKPKRGQATGKRDSSGPLESVAALGIQLEEQLEGLTSKKVLNSSGTKQASQPIASKIGDARSPDFGIEEVENDSEDEAHPKYEHAEETTKGLAIGRAGSSIKVDTNDSKINDNRDDTLDSSIQDIENYMDSQLYFAGDDNEKNFNLANDTTMSNLTHSGLNKKTYPGDSPTKGDTDLSREVSISEPSSFSQDTYDQTDNTIDNIDIVQGEKDPELEELLDYVNWKVFDKSDDLMKKLNKELNNIKYSNIKELVSLEFGNDSVSSDVAKSLGEVDNLSRVFKKMEIDFKFLAPEVNLIENDSKGLQVKSVNKKLLYNDLSGILSKLSVNKDDLVLIENFHDFERLNRLESLEQKLLNLYNALGTTREDSNEGNDLSSMRALRQYRKTYESVTAKFIKQFSSFIQSQFNQLGDLLLQNLERFYPHVLFRELNNLLIYSGVTYFIKDISPDDFFEINNQFNLIMSEFFEKFMTFKLKHMKRSSSSISPHISQSLENHTPLKKTRTLRLSTRREKFRNSIGLSREDTLTSEDIELSQKSPKEVNDVELIIALVDETKELISIVQYFIGKMFHCDASVLDFNDYIKQNPYKLRRKLLDEQEMDVTESRANTNDLISNLNAVFGNYINLFIKKIMPSDLKIPLLLHILDNSNQDSEKHNQDFVTFNFLRKVREKYKGLWTRLVKSQVEALNKSTIVAKSGVLPAVKNTSQLLVLTESSFDQSSRKLDDFDRSNVRSMLDDSYSTLTEAAIHLFMRDDPLLKNHDFDDKEKEYRNVSIIQNIFYLTEQLAPFNSDGIKKMKSQFEAVFLKIRDVYFDKLLNKNIGKLMEFVTGYEALSKVSTAKPKKHNKKYVKSLLTNYSNKDISIKANEIFKKLEKHFITGGDMLEAELLDRLWSDMERLFVSYFSKLDTILKSNFDRDIDYHVSTHEIHQIFRSIH